MELDCLHTLLMAQGAELALGVQQMPSSSTCLCDLSS